MAMTRRQVVAGSVFCAGLLASGGVVSALGGRSLLRPPGGQDEERLLANCLRCDRCRSACPQNCIAVAHVEDGFVNMRTPRLDYRRGICDFCGECLRVCPTQALVPFDETVEKIGIAVVDSQECLAFRSTGCKACYEKCPYEAISLTANDRPVVDEALCNGCGVCEYVCPSTSFGSFDGSQKRGINVEWMGVRS